MTWLGSRSICSSKELTTSLISPVVSVPSFLGDDVKLIKEKHTRSDPDCREERVQPTRGLAEEGTDERFVAHGQQRNGNLGGDGLGQSGLPAPGRALQQDPVARLDSVAPEQIAAMVLFDDVCGSRAPAAGNTRSAIRRVGSDS